MLGFPCNQFAGQEPGTDAEILAFATSTYDVIFPLFSKIDVNGDSACDLYKWLKAQASAHGDITWNFEKFLVDRSGNVVARFPPQTAPESIGEELRQYL